MKPRCYLIVLVASLLAHIALGQDFISENKQWNVKVESWGSIYTEIFKIDGDTVINEISYKKVWQTYDSTMTEWYFVGGIREESHVVYFKMGDWNEGILYDFNLQVGDTAYVTNLYCMNMQIVVSDIDTVNYFGVDRTRWLFDDWSEESWVEGIGSLSGPLHTDFANCIFDVWFELLCFYQEDSLFYIKPGEDECFQTSVGIDEKSFSHTMLILPNPVQSGQPFSIQTNKKIRDILIYNLSGVQVDHIFPDHQRNISVSTDRLKAGLYLVRMRSTDQKVYSEKMIIK